jgi:hypothetical protein
MATAIAVIALALAVGAMGVAWRAWPRDSRARVAGGRAASNRLTRAVEVLVVLDLLAGAGLGVTFIRNGSRVTSLGPTHPAGAGSPTSTTSVPRSALGGTSSSAPPTSAPSSPVPSSPAPSSPATSSPATSSPAPSSLASSRSSTSRRPSAKLGPRPVLLEISPASGPAGRRVTLRGRGFFSADGQITVTFGAAQAPVACPSETTCHATVPSRPGISSATVPVRVSTETGRSNPVAFSYA